jgi:soluble lytic murein transglycosylase-like protein
MSVATSIVSALPLGVAGPPPGSHVPPALVQTTDVAEQVTTTVAQSVESLFDPTVPFASIIQREAQKNGLAPELVAAVIKQESKFNAKARSGAGAIGLMQLLPKTGRWMGAKNLLDPAQNIAAGTKYLKYLSDQFDGNEKKILAAYNAGEGAVRRFGGIPPFRETMKYVQNVLRFRSDFEKATDPAA